MRANTGNKEYPQSSGITLDEFLDRLDKVKRVNKHWMACCPAHDDSKPSLKINCGGDRILVHCWSGCTYHEITAAMGLYPRDLFYDALSDDKRREYQHNHITRRIQTADTIIYFGDKAMTSGTITDDSRKEYANAIATKQSLIDERNNL